MPKTLHRFHLRCETCGWRYEGTRRITICRQYTLGGFGTKHWCRGHLAPVARSKKKGPDLDQQITYAERKLKEGLTRVKLAVTVVGRWQTRLKRLTAKKVAALQAARPIESAIRTIRREELP